MTEGYLQGGFFILVPPNVSTKMKITNKPITAAVPEILLLRKAVIGCLAVFFSVLKLGGTSEKNHPVFILGIFTVNAKCFFVYLMNCSDVMICLPTRLI